MKSVVKQCMEFEKPLLPKKYLFEKTENTAKAISYIIAEMKTVYGKGGEESKALLVHFYGYVYNYHTFKQTYERKDRHPDFTAVFHDDKYFVLTSDGRKGVDKISHYGAYGEKKFLSGSDIVLKHLSKYDSHDPWERIKQESESCRDNRMQKKHQKEIDAIDSYMNLILPLPADLDSWIDDVALQDSKYIFYKKKSKKVFGFCTHCKKYINPDVAYHNQNGICPACGRKIKFKAEGMSTRISDWHNFVVMENGEKGLVAREFRININFVEDYKNPKIFYYETQRWFIAEDKHFEYGTFKQKYERWCNQFSDKSVGFDAYLYSTNVSELIAGTDLKYSALYEYAVNAKKTIHLENFIRAYRKHPCIEYFVKMGLYNLVRSMTDSWHTNTFKLNMQGETVNEILGLSKDEIKRCIKMDLSLDEFGFFKQILKTEIKFDDNELRWFLDNVGFNLLILRRPMGRVINYLKKQFPIFKSIESKRDKPCCMYAGYYASSRNEISISSLAKRYEDYLEMCKKLHKNLNDDQVVFPKNICEAHDDVNAVLRAVEEEKRKKEDAKRRRERKKAEKLVEKSFSQYTQYEFKDKKLLIKLPTSVSEIVAEGDSLQHCVGRAGYIEKMGRGESLIMFVRMIDAPNDPFFTAEIDLKKSNVIQCRGKKNCGLTKEVEAFMKKYQKKLDNIKIKESEKPNTVAS